MKRRRFSLILVLVMIVTNVILVSGNNKTSASAESLITALQPTVKQTVDSTGIVHPGVGINAEQLDTMQTHVRAGDEPWLSAFQLLVNESGTNARIYYESGNDCFVNVPSGDDGLYVGHRAQWDSSTAIKQAVLWYITGNDAYRANCMTILRDYSQIQSIAAHSDVQIRWGIATYQFCIAAEIMRYCSYTGNDASLQWTTSDTEAFTNLLGLTYTYNNRYWHYINQHCFCTMGFMGSAIFRNDLEDYTLAVERTTVNAEQTDKARDGSILYQIPVVGIDADGNNIVQLNEAGRDNGHPAPDVGGLSQLAMTTYIQGTLVDPTAGTVTTATNGINVFEFGENRILAGANYTAKYNLGYDAYYYGGYSDYNTIAMWDTSRGRVDNQYGVLYCYYKYIAGMDMNSSQIQYVADTYEKFSSPEGSNKDYPGLATLFYTPDSATSIGYTLSSDIVYPGEGDTYNQVENFTALRKGSATILSEGSTTFVRCDATNGGTEIANSYQSKFSSAKTYIKLCARTNGEATVKITRQDISYDTVAEYPLPNTNNQWKEFYCDISNATNTAGTVTFYTITGTATQVDLDYIDFNPSSNLGITGIDYNNTVYTQSKSGNDTDYVVINQDYTASVLTTTASNPQLSINGIPATVSGTKYSITPTEVGDYTYYVTVSDGIRQTSRKRNLKVFATVSDLIQDVAYDYNAYEAYSAESLKTFRSALSQANQIADNKGYCSLVVSSLESLATATANLHRLNQAIALSDGGFSGSIGDMMVLDLASIATITDANGNEASATYAILTDEADSVTDLRYNGSGNGGYLQFNLGNGYGVNLSEVYILNRQDKYSTRTTGALIQGSNDGTTWTSLTSSAANTTSWQNLSVLDSNTYRYIRFANPGVNWYGNAAELRILGNYVETTSATIDLSTIAVTASNGKSGATIDEAGLGSIIDSDLNTFVDVRVTGGTQGYGGWIIFDLGEGETATVTGVEVAGRPDQYYTRIKGTVLQGSNTAVDNDWTTLTSTAVSTTGMQQLSMLDSTNSYRYLRIYNANNWYGNLAEIAIYGTKFNANAELTQLVYKAEHLNPYGYEVDSCPTIASIASTCKQSIGQNTQDVTAALSTLSNAMKGLTAITNEINLSALHVNLSNGKQGKEATEAGIQDLFDDNKATFLDVRVLNGYQGNGGWIVFDMGFYKRISLSFVILAGRPDQYYTRIKHTVIQGSNTGSDDWVDLTTQANSIDGYQTLTVTDSTPYRYLRVYNYSNWYGNIAELRVYGKNIQY